MKQSLILLFFSLLLLLFTNLYLRAAIQYTDITPDKFIPAGDADINPPFGINMDNSGAEEFELQNYYDPAWFSEEIYCAIFATGADVVSNPTTTNVSILSAGTTIGAISNFSGVGVPGFPEVSTTGYTTWLGTSNRYIGVKFLIGANTHYGWIEISGTASGDITVHGYAYEDTPGASIDAGATSSVVLVAGITVSGFGGATSISSPAGTLQMIADVSPVSATNDTVTWSVDDPGIATIDAVTGMLTAVSNGVVEVTATAVDGSGISGSAFITVENQGVYNESEMYAILDVYPNPVSSHLSIKCSVPASFSLYNMHGVEVWHSDGLSTNELVSVEIFSAGIYKLVGVTQKGQKTVSSVVIQN